MTVTPPTSPTPAVETKGLRMRYGRTRVLDGVDLSLASGSTTVLLGRNGAGKTTFLRLLAGLLRPESGTVRVLGLDPARDRRALSERTGFLPDAPDVWPWMTLVDLRRFLAAHHPRWDGARADDWARRLEAPLDRPFGSMSRGDATKALLSATLATDPEVLLLDEPFAGLDPVAREDVLRGLVEALSESAPRTTLLSTHDLDVAARMADRALVLEGGRISREVRVEGSAETTRVLREALGSAGRSS